MRHVPAGQLLRRVSLMLRRRFTMSPLGTPWRTRRNTPLPLADELPTALLALRTHLVAEEDGQFWLQQLNRRYSLNGEIDWRLSREDQPSHLERLAFHYLEFLEAIPVEQGESIVLDWIERNPPWQPGYWLDTWNSYAVSIRSVCMMQWLGTHRDTLQPDTISTVCGSIAEQLRFLERNLELDICGNHLMKNIKALLWAGRFFEGPEADRWFDRGHALLQQQLPAQFLPDGLHFELSPAYHCQVFADVLECVSVLSVDDQRQMLPGLQPSAQAISDLTHPDGRISLFSDGGLNMAYLPEQCLAAWERLAAWRTSDQLCFGLTSSGYYGARFDPVEGVPSYVVFDCGPSCADALPAHGHGDILAFEWDVDGQRVIVDAGVREYEAGPERARNRSTLVHNTVTVGDRDQCEFLKSFRVGHRAHGRPQSVDLHPDSFSVTGCYTARSVDGQQVDHRRTLSATADSLVVSDRVDSLRAEPAVARLLLHHDCVPTVEDDTTLSVAIGTTVIRIESDSPVRLRPATWSPDFGTEHQTTQVEFEYGSTPCRSGFRLTIRDETSR